MLKRILIIFALAFVTDVWADTNDFGIWSVVDVEKKVNKNLTIDAEAEYRTRDNVGESDCWSVGIGADYKVLSWLKTSVSYLFIYDHNYKVNDNKTKYADYWGPSHRVKVSLTFSKSFGNLNISLRERWQYTYQPEKTVQRYYLYDTSNYNAGDEADIHTFNSKNAHKWRNRLQLKYKITKVWQPYISAESTVGRNGLDRMRYCAGTEINLTNQHSLDIKYLFQKDYKDATDNENRHVICFGYTFKF